MNQFQNKKFNIETSFRLAERAAFPSLFGYFASLFTFGLDLLCFCLFMTTKPWINNTILYF